MNNQFETLRAKYKEILTLGQIEGLLSWDQETMMPAKGAEMRAEQMGLLASIAHQKISDPTIGYLIYDIDPFTLDHASQVDLHQMRLAHERAVKIPAQLAADLAKTTALSQGIWADARAKQDFAAFAPTLTEVLRLRREEASYLRVVDQTHYDALLNDYEPGSSATKIGALFDELQPRLRALRAKIAARPQMTALRGAYPKDAQLDVSREIAAEFGYDFEAGRLDLAVHPFSSGGFDDTRITTRVDEQDPFNCIYSTIHETGHSVYEHNISRDLIGRASGIYASMGIHESQSRLFENQIGRGRAYMDVLHKKMRSHFPKYVVENPDALYRVVNRVETGFIRTEADELHYNLHIILRFGLEQDLIAGNLEVADLEAEWNRRFKADFGMDVPSVDQGVLQDVHWSVGLFGYFPTYALGNIYAACLFEKIQADIPDLDAQVAAGDNAAWIGWLNENVHQHGRLFAADELVTRATGKAPTVEPLMNYLEAKFNGIFDK